MPITPEGVFTPCLQSRVREVNKLTLFGDEVVNLRRLHIEVPSNAMLFICRRNVNGHVGEHPTPHRIYSRFSASILTHKSEMRREIVVKVAHVYASKLMKNIRSLMSEELSSQMMKNFAYRTIACGYDRFAIKCESSRSLEMR